MSASSLSTTTRSLLEDASETAPGPTAATLQNAARAASLIQALAD
ncbi:hypothetical protein [Haematospirillum sp. 15-248]|nr:hypothetical protein [Haematospirillum sp. 15-248]